jgi:hypothetical protein
MRNDIAPEAVAAPDDHQFETETNTTPDGGAAASDAQVSSDLSDADAEAQALQSVVADEPSDADASDAGSKLNQKKRSLSARKQTYQNQINELAKQRGDLHRAYESERREYDALRAARTQAAPPAPSQARPAPVDPDAPQEEQFETYGDYVKAAARHESRRAVMEAQHHARQSHEAHQRQAWESSRNTAHEERLAAHRTTNPEFDVLVNREDINLSTPMVDVIKASDHGPGLMVHMAHHPDDAQRIAALHPVLAFGEMKALEARLDVAHGSTPPSKPMSKAKPPIKPVGTTLSGSVDDPSELEFGREYVSRMNKLERSRRTHR